MLQLNAMASTGVDYGGSHDHEKVGKVDPENNGLPGYRRESIVSVKTVRDSTHRKLKPRHIQVRIL